MKIQSFYLFILNSDNMKKLNELALIGDSLREERLDSEDVVHPQARRHLNNWPKKFKI